MSQNTEQENTTSEQKTPSANKSETPAAVSADVAEYEARSSRLKNLLLSGSKRNKTKLKKKADPNKLKHAKFQREVDAGLYQPTDEETNQIVLVPHFENIKFYKFKKMKTTNQNEKNEPKLPPGMSIEEYNQIHDEIAKESEKLYNRNLPKKFKQNIAPKKPQNQQPSEFELKNNQDDFMVRNNSCELLRKAIIKLDNEVKMIENQNTVLAAHLQVLDKAKQRLELTAQCSIEAIQWEKQKIEEYYKSHPDVPRLNPKITNE